MSLIARPFSLFQLPFCVLYSSPDWMPATTILSDQIRLSWWYCKRRHDRPFPIYVVKSLGSSTDPKTFNQSFTSSLATWTSKEHGLCYPSFQSMYRLAIAQDQIWLLNLKRKKKKKNGLVDLKKNTNVISNPQDRGIASEHHMARHFTRNDQTELDCIGGFDASLRSGQSNWFFAWGERLENGRGDGYKY